VLTGVHLPEQAGVARGLPPRDRGAAQRVGLDATVTAISARLVRAAAADLLADFCPGTAPAPVRSGRVGKIVRRLGDPLPTWLQHVGADLGQVV